MTDEEKRLVERRYLLVKRGLYYAPDRQGYTGVKASAGRYREVDALGLDGVTAVHEDEAPDFAPACWEETKLAHLNGIIETQARENAAKDAEIERLREGHREVFEEWAGSEGFIPETMPEAYLLQLTKRMADIARAALAGDSQ